MSDGYRPDLYQYQYNPIMQTTAKIAPQNYPVSIQDLLNKEIPNYVQKFNKIFENDESYNPFLEKSLEIRKLAENFLNVIKNQYPNRYFILKKVTKQNDLWEIALNKNLLIINEENSIQKLKSVLEVIIFFFLETLRFFVLIIMFLFFNSY
jgi:hypothetical protein